MESIPSAIIDHASRGQLIHLFAKHSSESSSDGYLQIAPQLHNSGKIDIIKAYTGSTPQSQGHDFFQATHFLNKILKDIESREDQVVDCVSGLIQAAKGDMSAGWITEGFEAYCKAKQGRASLALRAILQQPDHDFILLHSALVAMSTEDASAALTAAIDMTNSESDIVRRRAMSAIGSLLYNSDISSLMRAERHMLDVLADPPDSAQFSSVIHACSDLHAQDKEFCTQWLRAVDGHKYLQEDVVIYAFAETLFRRSRDYPEGAIEKLCRMVLPVKSAHKGTIERIDFAASALVEAGNLEMPTFLAEELVGRDCDPIDCKNFDSFQHRIVSDGHLNHLAVKWLLTGKYSLCKFVTKIISDIHGSPITLTVPENLLGKSREVECHFLARKAVGFLFSVPVTAASLIISCAAHCPDSESRDQVLSYLFDPLLRNYSGKLKLYLDDQISSSDDSIKPGIQRQVNKYESWMEELRKRPRTKELRPPEAHRAIALRKFSDETREAFRKASDDSPLLSLVHKVTILYGKRAATIMRLGNDESGRQEIEMKTSSCEVEIPRESSLDPWGLDYRLRVFRVERMRQ